MNKRAILLILFTLLTLFQAHAVLKEQDLESTLSILRTELTNYHAELERQSGYMKSQQAAIRDKLFSIMGQSNQNALMLYSQNMCLTWPMPAMRPQNNMMISRKTCNLFDFSLKRTRQKLPVMTI